MSDETEIIEGEIVDEAAALPVATGSAVAVRESTAMVAQDEISVGDLLAQSEKIAEAMRQAMQEGTHYGRIPGVNKPTLLKPGAEKLLVLFRLAPHYESEKIWGPGDHLTVMVKCELHHAPTGIVVATGEGMCSTRESRYAYRQGGRTCPECGQPAIIKGKAEYGGGWLCFKKKDGCGAQWPDGSEQAQTFEGAETGRVDNPDIPDQWGTVLKMADKRALVAAILNGTAASDVFTQDMEDAPRGAQASSESPAVEREFDPGRDLLDGAIKGKDAPKRLADALNAVDLTVEWGDVFEQASPGWRDLKGEAAATFWKRLSNTVEHLRRQADPAGFPPAADEVIVAAFAWGFEGAVVTLTRPGEQEVPASGLPGVDDIPFGDGGGS